ncbi:M48 family metallopeptidase [Parvibium lacunae]|uniref:Peptidase n=1 Tax=Parvibium lacunae TaxID=1888893 RepID=A0A368L206_9BURK|nr:M48 family metallopeptidase [Parvibium lacunae]RCS57542.1 peptidase [Parvibium lacunae]
MQFFVEQAQARRRSRRLLWLFALLVLFIVVVVNIIATYVWIWVAQDRVVPHYFYFTNTAIIVLLIVGGAWIEIQNLRAGGTRVAEMAGGRRIQPNTRDQRERRLLNVVEEMALAAGVVMPAVYVLEHSDGINAFAAGHDRQDVALAVTQGAMQRLTRDELQGVIAHEFSHILNGDMALNIRLLGLVFGLQMVADFGHWLLNHTPRRQYGERNHGFALIWFAAGMTLLLLGYLGEWCGRLLRASLSRQREYLADASAVQFTRQVEGIGGALRKIGGLGRQINPRNAEAGSFVIHPSSDRLSHFYLGPVNQAAVNRWLATHPPLARRLEKLYGRSVTYLAATIINDGIGATADLPPLSYQVTNFSDARRIHETLNPVAGLIQSSPEVPDFAAQIGQPGPAQQRFAQRMLATDQADQASTVSLPLILKAAHEPYTARALVYAMLWAEQGEVRDQQALDVAVSLAPPARSEIERYRDMLNTYPASLRLPLLDVCTPALRLMAKQYLESFLQTVQRVIEADQRLSLTEFMFQTLLQQRLAASPQLGPNKRYASYASLQSEIACVLHLLAYVAAPGRSTRNVPHNQAICQQAVHQGLAVLALKPIAIDSGGGIAYPQISASIQRIRQLAPLRKPAFLQACVETALVASSPYQHQRQLTMVAAEFLRTLCAAIDTPLPPQVSIQFAEADALCR